MFYISFPGQVSNEYSLSRNLAKSTGGAKGKGKITPYNKFMKEELARLKDQHPDMKHPER